MKLAKHPAIWMWCYPTTDTHDRSATVGVQNSLQVSLNLLKTLGSTAFHLKICPKSSSSHSFNDLLVFLNFFKFSWRRCSTSHSPRERILQTVFKLFFSITGLRTWDPIEVVNSAQKLESILFLITGMSYLIAFRRTRIEVSRDKWTVFLCYKSSTI